MNNINLYTFGDLKRRFLNLSLFIILNIFYVIYLKLKLDNIYIMNNIDINEFNKLKEENEELKKKNNELEEKLKSYTNNHRHKKYYDNNTEIVKERAKNYMEKIKETNPDKLKEWRHTAYLNRKAKLQTQIDNK
jgi:cell division protein FtsB